ncbi:MAG: dihydroorotase [Chloroflexota bacterium]|nr:dihydroorotase [Chloroflexota bacterium]
MNKSVLLLIHNGRIIDLSQGIDLIGDLLVDDGKIIQIGMQMPTVIASEAKQAQAIDATGLIVCPGFIDLHCHLREPGFEDKETIATGTKAAAKGGFTTVCCMANTIPPLDNRATVEWVKQKARKDGFTNVLPIGCITKGRRGEEICEMTELAEAGVVGFSDDGDPVSNSLIMRQALDRSYNLGLPIIDHCEDKTLSDGGVINEGRISAKLGLKGMPAAAEEIMVARDTSLAKLTGANVHIAHVSTCGSVELIRRAKEEGIPVTAEVTPHHLTLTEEEIMDKGSLKPSPLQGEGRERVKRSNLLAFDTNAKVNPPLRTEQDIKCLIKGLNEGVIDAIATDHAPHTLADKKCGLELAAFGISGFETAFGCLTDLVHKGKISMPTLISKLTHEPAKIIGKYSELGTLKAVTMANITILDPDREWIVNSHDFVSKGKNTPYDGYKFRGKVMATIVNGRIVYIDSSYSLKPSGLKGEGRVRVN